MRIASLFEEAWLAIRTNRSRTALTMLGIVIGVGSVIAVVGVGDGAKQVVGDLLGQFGSTSLIVYPNVTAIRESRGRYRFEEITREDIEAINEGAPSVRAVTPEITMEVELRAGEASVTATLLGTMHQYIDTGQGPRRAGQVPERYGRPLPPQGRRHGSVAGRVAVPRRRPGRAHGQGEQRNGRGDRRRARARGAVLHLDRLGFRHVRQTGCRALLGPLAHGRLGEGLLLTGDAVSVDRTPDATAEILAVLDANHGRWDGTVQKYAVQEMGQVLGTTKRGTDCQPSKF